LTLLNGIVLTYGYDNDSRIKRHNIAVTVYNNIYIRAGEYDPSTAAGFSLLAHELYHVGQYRRNEMSRWSYLMEAARHGGGPENRFEKPAYVFGDKVNDELQKVKCLCSKK
jgi:uncharacterized protein DUF4157